MFGQRFRLRTPTLVVVIENGKEALRYVPAGAEIVVTVGLQGEAPKRQVSAEWEGKAIMMFAVDILERGEQVRAAKGL